MPLLSLSGYGNQAPVTDAGRLLIVTAGLGSLVAFAAVLGLCGYVLMEIFDDFVDRFWFSKWISYPPVGVILWGAIWLLYTLAIAADVQYWWQHRIPSFGDGVTRIDAMWFAYISIATIGLGDYYLQPEVLFAGDTLKYSVLFMIGFVFLSTFFGKIAEVLSAMIPQKHNSLPSRLAGTRLLACWPKGWMPWETPVDVRAALANDDWQDHQDLVVDPDDQALVYRIEQVQELKPDPPVEDDEDEDGDGPRGIVSALQGNPILSLNVELLQQEENLLLEWLAVVQHQKGRALAKRQAEGYGEVSESAVTPRDGEILPPIPEGVPWHDDEKNPVHTIASASASASLTNDEDTTSGEADVPEDDQEDSNTVLTPAEFGTPGTQP